MADVFLIVAITVALLILLVVGFYLLIKYQHPDDKNEAYFPKVVVLFGFIIAGGTVLLLPLDVANNEGFPGCDGYSTQFCGGLDMELFWNIVFWLIPVWIFILIPFSTFYYEADDGTLMAGAPGFERSPIAKSKLRQALCGELILLVIVGLVFYLTYEFLSDTTIPVQTYVGATVDLANAGSTQPNDGTTKFSPSQLEAIGTTDADLLADVRNVGSEEITLQVDVATFYAGLMAWLGWFFFAVFGGIGLAALPLDWILNFVNRPTHMSPSEFAEAQLSIQQRVNELVSIGEDLKREREERNKAAGSSGGGGGGWFNAEKRKENRAENKTMKEFKAAVYVLEKDVEDFQACSANLEKYNPLWPWISLLLGILALLLTLLWIIQICLYIIPPQPVTPFLNDYFKWFDNWFPLFGVLSVALFSVYLLFCAVKGCFKFGLRFLCIDLHPMKINATYMSSFMFNIGLVLLCSLPVVQFCQDAFADYARFATIRQIFGVQIENLKFFSIFWTNNIFVYALLAMVVLTFIYLWCKPRDASKDSAGLRDRLKSRRS